MFKINSFSFINQNNRSSFSSSSSSSTNSVQRFPSKLVKNSRGQGMIEYMILVALIAIGTIGVVKVVGQNVGKQFENINRGLGAKKTQKLQLDNASDGQTNRKDLSNFMDGARNE